MLSNDINDRISGEGINVKHTTGQSNMAATLLKFGWLTLVSFVDNFGPWLQQKSVSRLGESDNLMNVVSLHGEQYL